MQAHRSVFETALPYQRMLADAMPILVMMADPDGTVTFFNKAWFEFTGQPPFERDVERDWRRYIHPEDSEKVAADWGEAVARNASVIDMEYRLREGHTGIYRWVKARATAMRDESGEIVQWIGTAMDIDDARRANSALSEIAEAYQSASLPFLPRTINGLTLSYAYRASTRSLRACGDWYDAFALSGGHTALCIGDVSGHGLHAATLMAKYRMAVRAVAARAAQLQTFDSASVFESVENAMTLESAEANATAFFALVSADRNTLQWANAGHPPALLVRKDGRAEWLGANEPALGWRFGIPRTFNSTRLEDAQTLVLYTDGLIEASHNIIVGMEQLRERVLGGQHARELAEHILEGWSPAPVEDDVAILTISF